MFFSTSRVFGVVSLCLGLAGCDFFPAPPSESDSAAANDTALEHALKHLDPTYICPMHPQIVSDEPGSCPICGMDLVEQAPPPTAMAEPEHSLPAVQISPTILQRLGVRTKAVQHGTLTRHIDTVGSVHYAEDRISHVHARASGWVEHLAIETVGDSVQRGQKLLDMYAPEVLRAQEDYLVALKTYPDRPALQDGAANRLRLFNLPNSFIEQLKRRRVSSNHYPMLAPQKGVVTELHIREGMYVTPTMELYTIVDLSEVWVIAEVYEKQIDWLRTGLYAEMRVPARPSKVWKGEVAYLYPTLDPVSRTLKVRLRFANPDQQLTINMFAHVTIHGDPKPDTLYIPRNALIVTGTRQSVIVAVGEGRFQPVDVQTGMQRDDDIEILAGLSQEQQVVVEGQFLIDSEANLQASFQRFRADTGENTSPPVSEHQQHHH